MTTIVFILGRPGSGKSVCALRIAKLAQRMGRSTSHINDYTILHRWFMAEMYNPENSHTYFKPTKHGGFDVIDFSVLRLALEEVNKKVQKCIEYKIDLVLIEFARGSYTELLEAFSHEVLCNAYFLFLESDLPTCFKRIQTRTTRPTTRNDHYVSKDILWSYYAKDNKAYILSQFANDYDLNRQRIKVIDNVGSWEDLMQQVKEFSDIFLEQKQAFRLLQDHLPKPSIRKRTGPLSGAFPSLGSPAGCGCNLTVSFEKDIKGE